MGRKRKKQRCVKWDRNAIPDLEFTPADEKKYMERWNERFRAFDQIDALGEWLAETTGVKVVAAF